MEEVALEYNFGADKLLINVSNRQFKNLKTLFKQKSKTESIKMHFLEKSINVTGEINTKVNYSISTSSFDNYLNFADMSGNMIKADNFEICIPLRYCTHTMKIAEILEANFMAAMELTSEDSCTLYMITEDAKHTY